MLIVTPTKMATRCTFNIFVDYILFVRIASKKGVVTPPHKISDSALTALAACIKPPSVPIKSAALLMSIAACLKVVLDLKSKAPSISCVFLAQPEQSYNLVFFQ